MNRETSATTPGSEVGISTRATRRYLARGMDSANPAHGASDYGAAAATTRAREWQDYLATVELMKTVRPGVPIRSVAQELGILLEQWNVADQELKVVMEFLRVATGGQHHPFPGTALVEIAGQMVFEKSMHRRILLRYDQDGADADQRISDLEGRLRQMEEQAAANQKEQSEMQKQLLETRKAHRKLQRVDARRERAFAELRDTAEEAVYVARERGLENEELRTRSSRQATESSEQRVQLQELAKGYQALLEETQSSCRQIQSLQDQLKLKTGEAKKREAHWKSVLAKHTKQAQAAERQSALESEKREAHWKSIHVEQKERLKQQARAAEKIEADCKSRLREQEELAKRKEEEFQQKEAGWKLVLTARLNEIVAQRCEEANPVSGKDEALPLHGGVSNGASNRGPCAVQDSTLEDLAAKLELEKQRTASLRASREDTRKQLGTYRAKNEELLKKLESLDETHRDAMTRAADTHDRQRNALQEALEKLHSDALERALEFSKPDTSAWDTVAILLLPIPASASGTLTLLSLSEIGSPEGKTELGRLSQYLLQLQYMYPGFFDTPLKNILYRTLQPHLFGNRPHRVAHGTVTAFEKVSRGGRIRTFDIYFERFK